MAHIHKTLKKTTQQQTNKKKKTSRSKRILLNLILSSPSQNSLNNINFITVKIRSGLCDRPKQSVIEFCRPADRDETLVDIFPYEHHITLPPKIHFNWARIVFFLDCLLIFQWLQQAYQRYLKTCLTTWCPIQPRQATKQDTKQMQVGLTPTGMLPPSFYLLQCKTFKFTFEQK